MISLLFLLSKKVVSSDVSTENEVGFICIYNPGNSAMYASTLLSLLLTFADGVKKFCSLGIFISSIC